MRQFLLLLSIFLVGSGAKSQISYDILAPIPESVSNNAVASVEIDGDWYVYSFAGIDDTKVYSGIHSRVYKYDVSENLWTDIAADLPGGQNRIAAGASTVKGKIYVLGGYQVFSNQTEFSINKMHVYDPITDSFEEDAAPIPTAIDDHVQCVYKDSLVYVVTGWSNFNNVSDVWIFDPENNLWTAGTSIPNDNDFQAFGASGEIVGDTLYFIGGAKDIGSFSIQNGLRKGYINPLDPSDITWTISENANAEIYRAGVSTIGDNVLWLGGSENTYNYNGIAYDGSGGVEAMNSVIFYDPLDGQLIQQFYDFPVIMDLRGLAKIGSTSFITVGGMMENQAVTDRVIRYDIGELVSKELVEAAGITMYPNPSNGRFYLYGAGLDLGSKLEIRNRWGQIVHQSEVGMDGYVDLGREMMAGVYYVLWEGGVGKMVLVR